MSKLPTIEVTADIAGMAIDAWKALIAKNNPPTLFDLGGQLAEVRGQGPDARLVPLNRDALRHRLRRCAKWIRGKTTKSTGRPADPPSELVNDMLVQNPKPLPSVDYVGRSPVFMPDGALLLAPGYHESSKTLMLLSEEHKRLSVSDDPSEEEISSARSWICSELLYQFPFVSDASRAHTVGLMLLPLVRPMITGPTPLHLITKPAVGAGATLLAEVCMVPIAGKAVPVHPAPKAVEEWRKTITSTLLEHPSFVIFDNIKGRLAAGALAAALTTEHWIDRRMGVSENISVPIHCAWIGTANNPDISSEIRRRVVHIRLDPGVERAFERTGWKYALPQWAIEKRMELVHSLCTLVSAWVAAGRPPAKHAQPLGRFESWSATVGGILEHCGIPGFMTNQESFYSSHDDDSDAWRRFFDAWYAKFAGERVGVAKLLPLAQSLDVLDLGESLGDQARVLGHRLRKKVDCQFGNHRITAAGLRSGARVYRLTQVVPNT